MSERFMYIMTKDEETIEFTIDATAIGILLYYAKELDFNKGKNFYHRLSNEFSYKIDKNLTPTQNTEDTQLYCYYESTEISDAIDFIENDLIPSLEQMPNQKLALINIYGGIGGFIEEFELNKEYIDLYFPYDQCYDETIDGYIYLLQGIKDIFQISLTNQEPYVIYYW
jgi:hypothetical protein